MLNDIAKDFFSYIGMRRATRDYLPRAAFGFGAGIIVGACAALMLAPKKGADMRVEVADTAQKLYQKGRDQVFKTIGQVEDSVNHVGV